jgi:hypothetical protein
MRRASCVTAGCDASRHQESRPREPLTVHSKLLGSAAAVAHVPGPAYAFGSWALTGSILLTYSHRYAPCRGWCVVGACPHTRHVGAVGWWCGSEVHVGYAPDPLVVAVQPHGRRPPGWLGPSAVLAEPLRTRLPPAAHPCGGTLLNPQGMAVCTGQPLPLCISAAHGWSCGCQRGVWVGLRDACETSSCSSAALGLSC